MPQEEEMDRQIPRFPVLFEVAAVPPVHIEVAVPELDYLWNDVQEEVEEGVEPHDPAHSVGDG